MSEQDHSERRQRAIEEITAEMLEEEVLKYKAIIKASRKRYWKRYGWRWGLLAAFVIWVVIRMSLGIGE